MTNSPLAENLLSETAFTICLNMTLIKGAQNYLYHVRCQNIRWISSKCLMLLKFWQKQPL